MRRYTKEIMVGNVGIGGDFPISIQSMTNTDTKNIDATVEQILQLEEAGCDIIRSAVNDEEDALAIKEIRRRIHIPMVSDIQFDYRLALAAVKNETDALRINPGNIGARWKVEEVVKACKEKSIPIRIGTNSGSVKPEFLDKYQGVNVNSLVYSTMEEVHILEEMGFTDICISIKSSDVRTMIHCYRKISELTSYPLHLGVTEAGSYYRGTVKSAIGIGTLLEEGIGDTIRVSLTEDPIREIEAGKEILLALGLKKGLKIVSCPTCARTRIDLISLTHSVEEALKNVDKNLTVAIMGCPVNGPGEAREADIGVAGGKGEGLLFRKGEVIRKVKEDEIIPELLKMVDDF